MKGIRMRIFLPLVLSVASGPCLAEDGPQIGAPDGVHYTVVSTKTVIKPAQAFCGTYGESPAPVPGEFKVETRQYSEYRGGSLVRSWTEESESFVQCREP